MYRKLRGKITEVYGTQEKFADAMDMETSALSNRLSGNTQWKAPEMAKACKLLGISFEEMYMYFF